MDATGDNEKRRVTVRDIAARLNLHYSTVAEALRGSKRIKESTRKKIEQVAEEMGYRRDPMLSALSNYRFSKTRDSFQGVIAWVDGYSPADGIRDEMAYNRDCFFGATQRATAQGYKLQEFQLGGQNITNKRISEILLNRSITGVILGPMPRFTRELSLEWENFVSVRIGYSFDNANITTILPDHYENVQWLFNEMRLAGFERIGFASVKWLDERSNQKSSAAYLRLMHEYFRGTEIPLYLDEIPEGNRARFLSWYNQYKPDAIIMGGKSKYYRMLIESGVRIPEDVSCAVMNAEHLRTKLAGVSQNGEVIGTIAVDHIISKLRGFQTGLESQPRTMMVKGRWISGNTFIPVSEMPEA